MNSMTGYGRAEYNKDGVGILVEIKTVNNRNLDVNCKTPRAFIAFEDLIRKKVGEKIKRGRVDLFLTFADKRETASELSLDMSVAKSYAEAAAKISERLNVINDLTVSAVMRFPDVILNDSLTEDMSEFEAIVSELVGKACDGLNAMRQIEGEKLTSDMCARMETVSNLVSKIAERAPFVAAEYREKLAERMAEVLKDVKYDEARLLSEVAFFSDKSNIDEELTRLRSHISQFYEIVKSDGGGKKLDFLIQEFNREANTVCSKSNDLTVTNLGLSLKNEIEKIREQVQNIE